MEKVVITVISLKEQNAKVEGGERLILGGRGFCCSKATWDAIGVVGRCIKCNREGRRGMERVVRGKRGEGRESVQTGRKRKEGSIGIVRRVRWRDGPLRMEMVVVGQRRG
jgi:hypothetical protein